MYLRRFIGASSVRATIPLAWIATGFLALLVSASPARAGLYTLVDLGAVVGAEASGSDVNNKGQVVGSVLKGDKDLGYSYDGHTVQFLGTLGGMMSAATAINDKGQIVGASSLTEYYPFQAFILDGSTLRQIAGFGGQFSLAYDINNQGQVIGYSTQAGTEFQRAFLYENGTTKDLGTLGGTTGRTGAVAINDKGQIVGYSTLAGTEAQRAFLYENGVMKDLGTLGGRSVAVGINESGQIVGYSDSGGANHAFLYENGVMKDLGTLGGSLSYATGINNLGQVVGYSDVAVGGERPFLYTPGEGMVDLNSLIDPSLGWNLWLAEKINDNGWIVGTGYNADGEMRGFLLKQNVVPEPSSLVLAALGLIACAGSALHHRRSTADA